MLAFTVLGKAEPAGSKRAFVNKKTGKAIVTDDNPKSRPWKQEVARAALDERERRGVELLTGPVELCVTFVQIRPRGHYGTGRNSDVLKPSAPARPIVRPDATKLCRCVEDALTGVLWHDDAQVVAQFISKEYGDPARAYVVIRELAATVADDHSVRPVTPLGPAPRDIAA